MLIFIEDVIKVEDVQLTKINRKEQMGTFSWWEIGKLRIQGNPKGNHILTPSPSEQSTKTKKEGRKEGQPRKKNKIKEMLRRLYLYSTHTTIPAPRLTSLFFLFLYLSNYDNFAKAHIFIYADCSQDTYVPNSPFEENHNSLLASIVSSSSQASYNSFAIGNGSTSPPEGICYGLYQCRGDLKTTDCSRCIESAVNQIGLVCPYSYGAALQLEACYVRYDHIDFLGRLDTNLKYKRCSKSVDNDVEFFRRRDDVLADLPTAMGFKVSCSGPVEGYAQCFGDLSSSDCSSCLADAVGQLKNLCGSAAADVYLGQCYARYWASGYYDRTSDSSNEDKEGKTVAIVVGILAGVAILIVLLSFCRSVTD